MKIGDPVIIGFPARGEPLVLGTWTGHQLDPDLIIGHPIYVNTEEGQALFRVNVSYVPDNPKRERLVTILEPKKELPADLWECEGFTKAEPKVAKPIKQEEFPF